MVKKILLSKSRVASEVRPRDATAVIFGHYPLYPYVDGKIIDTYVFNMDNRGYTRVTEREDADLGLQLSYVKNTYVYTDYGYPEWWWGYPGYWDIPYWGNWGGGWYYPYAVNYSFSTGSFLTELLNLEAAQGQNEKLPIIWSAYMSGMLSGSTEVNVELATQAVSQAFSQSTYLTNK